MSEGWERVRAANSKKHFVSSATSIASMDSEACTPKGVRNLVALDNYKHCTPNGVEFVACCAHPALAKAASRVKHDSVAVDHFSSVLSQTGGDN